MRNAKWEWVSWQDIFTLDASLSSLNHLFLVLPRVVVKSSLRLELNNGVSFFKLLMVTRTCACVSPFALTVWNVWRFMRTTQSRNLGCAEPEIWHMKDGAGFVCQYSKTLSSISALGICGESIGGGTMQGVPGVLGSRWVLCLWCKKLGPGDSPTVRYPVQSRGHGSGEYGQRLLSARGVAKAFLSPAERKPWYGSIQWSLSSMEWELRHCRDLVARAVLEWSHRFGQGGSTAKVTNMVSRGWAHPEDLQRGTESSTRGQTGRDERTIELQICLDTAFYHVLSMLRSIEVFSMFASLHVMWIPSTWLWSHGGSSFL